MNRRGTLAPVRRLLEVDPLRLAVGFAGAIAVLGVLGAVEVRYEAAPAFDLDAEMKIPAFAAGLILLCAATMCALAATTDPTGRRWPWLVLTALFTLMAVDEATGLHEALEDETGVDWQTLYLPLMAAGGIAWLALLRRLRTIRIAAYLLAAGAGLWVIAAVLEAIQWTGPMESERAVDGYGILMGMEELCELSGSACFALAPLIAARTHARVSA
jgi:prepilin signal peptidase PulO-like enzyme (type II secretory pathway)